MDIPGKTFEKDGYVIIDNVIVETDIAANWADVVSPTLETRSLKRCVPSIRFLEI